MSLHAVPRQSRLRRVSSATSVPLVAFAFALLACIGVFVGAALSGQALDQLTGGAAASAVQLPALAADETAAGQTRVRLMQDLAPQLQQEHSGVRMMNYLPYDTTKLPIVCTFTTQGKSYSCQSPTLLLPRSWARLPLNNTKILPLLAADPGTGAGLGVLRGQCLALSTLYGLTGGYCRCFGAGTGTAGAPYGPYGGSFCEVAPCLLPIKDDVSVMDPTFSFYPDGVTLTPLTVSNQMILEDNRTYSLPYEGSASPSITKFGTGPESRAMPSSITYQCQPGYVLAPDSHATITCSVRIVNTPVWVVGGWDYPVPRCVSTNCPVLNALDAAANITVAYSDETKRTAPAIGTVANYSCLPGFTNLYQAPLILTCLENSQWDNPEPTSSMCVATQCQPSLTRANGLDAHGTYQPMTGSTFETAVLTCDDGYYTTSNTTTCTATGAWTGVAADASSAEPAIRCKPVTCELSLQAPLQATLSTVQFGETTDVSCAAGYTLNPPPSSGVVTTLTCQQDGAGSSKSKWSADVPTCLRKCATVAAPANGTLTPGAGEYLEGQTVTVQCDPGFVLPNSVASQEVLCGGTGVYSPYGPTFECRALACAPLLISGTAMTVTSGDPKASVTGSRVTFACAEGFDLDGASTVYCEADSGIVAARWSSAAPTCTPRACLPLQAPAHGALSTPSGVTGSTSTVTCDAGYTAVPSTPIECLPTSQWSAQAQCTPNPCPTLAAPDHGTVNATAGVTGDVVSYSCAAGWDLSGAQYSLCLGTGLWSSAPPTCAIHQCPLLDAVAHSKPYSQVGWTGTTVQIECQSGYQMVGADSTTECLPTGLWSNALPQCQATLCAPLVAPQHGSVDKLTGVFGTNATFACDAGWELSRQPYYSCRVDTVDQAVKWLPTDFPTCIDLCADVDCGAHGSCALGVCECKDGYTGEQCQVAPASSSSSSTGSEQLIEASSSSGSDSSSSGSGLGSGSDSSSNSSSADDSSSVDSSSADTASSSSSSGVSSSGDSSSGSTSDSSSSDIPSSSSSDSSSGDQLSTDSGSSSSSSSGPSITVESSTATEKSSSSSTAVGSSSGATTSSSSSSSSGANNGTKSDCLDATTCSATPVVGGARFASLAATLIAAAVLAVTMRAF